MADDKDRQESKQEPGGDGKSLDDSVPSLKGKFIEQVLSDYEVMLETAKAQQTPYTITAGHASESREIAVDKPDEFFTGLEIKQYKLMNNVSIKNLKRINIFAGINNSGKSSLLEAVYLLIAQNDMNAFFEIMRRRGKFAGGLAPRWLMRQFKEPIQLEGVFNQKNVLFGLKREIEEQEDFDKSDYLGTISIDARFLNGPLTTKARIFKNKPPQMFFKSNKLMCNVAFSSPFSMQYKEDMVFYHNRSLENRSFARILTFLKTHVDEGIEDIDYEGDMGRFLVTHRDFDHAVDLAHFGEGMQRIFHITLQFAAAQNGVLLIDELENAIHFRLLNAFVAFIRNLAVEFNTQVFVTSHSGECIEAFVGDKESNKDISTYRLIRSQKGIECKYIPGEKLGRSIGILRFRQFRYYKRYPVLNR